MHFVCPKRNCKQYLSNFFLGGVGGGGVERGAKRLLLTMQNGKIGEGGNYVVAHTCVI